MQTKKWLFRFLYFALLFAILPIAHMSLAQPISITPFTGADILMLVDQSGSMGGPQYGQDERIPSDPTDMRFDAQRFVLDYTSDLDFHTLNNGRVRMAVIGFGDPELSTMMTWTEIATDGLIFDDFRSRKANISDILSPDFFGLRNFGYTDFYDAFREGQQLFEQLDPLPSGERNLRVVILITDGEPCLAEDINCTNKDNAHAQLARVQNLTSTAFPSTDYFIYMIALQNQATGLYMPDYQADWDRIILNSDRLVVVEEHMGLQNALLSFLREIFRNVTSSFKSIDVELIDGKATISIPPYVRLVRFNILKPDPAPNETIRMTLTDPNGNAYIKEDPRIEVSTDTANVETWALAKPDPGPWKIDVLPTDAEVDLSYDQASVLSDLEPTDPNYQWQAVPIATRLFFKEDSGNIPVTILPDYPLDVVAEIYPPASGRISLPLVPTNAVPQYSADFYPLVAGDYDVTVKANITGSLASSIAPELRQLLDTNTAGDIETITVNPVRPNVVFSDVLFAQGNDWLQTEPFSVCLQLLDGNPTATPTILRTGFDTLRPQIELQDSSGNPTHTIDLFPSSDMNCTFRSDFEFPTAGLFNVFLRGYLPDTQNPAGLTEVFQRTTQETFVNVRAVGTVSVDIVKPAFAEISEESLEALPPFAPRPLVLEIETRLNINGTSELVDLDRFITNPTASNIPFSISATYNGEPLSFSLLPRRIGQGTYQIEEYGLDTGSYNIRVTGAPLNSFDCQCQYVASSNTDSVTITRNLPISIFLFIFGALAILALILFVIYRIYRRRMRLRMNPLRGVFIISYETPEGEFLEYNRLDLDNLKVNTKTFSGHDLRLGHLGVAKVMMTNDGDKNSVLYDEGRMRVTFEMEKQQQLIPPQPITPNAPQSFIVEDKKTGDQYFINLENDELL